MGSDCILLCKFQSWATLDFLYRLAPTSIVPGETKVILAVFQCVSQSRSLAIRNAFSWIWFILWFKLYHRISKQVYGGWNETKLTPQLTAAVSYCPCIVIFEQEHGIFGKPLCKHAGRVTSKKMIDQALYREAIPQYFLSYKPRLFWLLLHDSFLHQKSLHGTCLHLVSCHCLETIQLFYGHHSLNARWNFRCYHYMYK